MQQNTVKQTGTLRQEQINKKDIIKGVLATTTATLSEAQKYSSSACFIVHWWAVTGSNNPDGRQ